MSARGVASVVGVGFVLLLAYGCYLQWQIWHLL